MADAWGRVPKPTGDWIDIPKPSGTHTVITTNVYLLGILGLTKPVSTSVTSTTGWDTIPKPTGTWDKTPKPTS